MTQRLRAVVTVQPAGASFEVAAGESVLVAAERAGLLWRSVCGGFAECRTCYMEILDGGEGLTAPEPLEVEALKLLGPVRAQGREVRLACQTCPRSDLVVRKIGVRPA